jgi:hypothetical protein
MKASGSTKLICRPFLYLTIEIAFANFWAHSELKLGLTACASNARQGEKATSLANV